MNRTRIAAALGSAAVLAAVVPVALAAPASADVEKRGACGNAGARYDFDVDRDDGRFEVSYEIDSNVRGQEWRLALFQNGNRVFRDVRTTDREGEADFERNRPDTAGADTFRAKAVHLGSGATCSVTITR